MKRLIIVVWKWGDDNQSSIRGLTSDEWPTETDDLLVRLDVRSDLEYPHIIDTASRFKDREILLFLHDSNPHFLGPDAWKEISKSLDKSIRLRVIHFSGGHEPIYFANNEWGILGINGRFPYREKLLSDGTFGNESVFIQSREPKRINKKHFDFIWDFYWTGRRIRILELAEELRIRVVDWIALDGAPEKDLQTWLQKSPLWDQLHTFSGLALSDDRFEYDMAAYHIYLRAKNHQDAAKNLEETRQWIKNQLFENPVNGAAAGLILEEIYNRLLGLFNVLPEDTL